MATESYIFMFNTIIRSILWKGVHYVKPKAKKEGNKKSSLTVMKMFDHQHKNLIVQENYSIFRSDHNIGVRQ